MMGEHYDSGNLSATAADKASLRRHIKELKQKQHPDLLDEESECVMQSIEDDPDFRQARTVLAYWALADEVNTRRFVDKWSGSKQILLPVVAGTELELKVYQGQVSMAKGAYGIDEPTGQVFTDLEKIDYAIVPGVAFDKYGHRMGRGKGYYDRLLPQLRQACKVGICFSFQFVDYVPTELHDICMDKVLHK